MELLYSFIGKIVNIDNVVCIKSIGYFKFYIYVGYEFVINNEKSKI